MPLKRTGLKLDFSLLNLPEKDDKKTHLPTDDYLKQHIDALLIQMKQMPISQAEPDSRVKRGAQITLYVRPVPGEHPYSAELLSEIRRFFIGLEYRLTEGGIVPGEYPLSDIRPPHWQFTSYRNEIISGREGCEADHQRLAESAFYRLMTDRD
ncbi:TPA: hypothetical protein QIM56_000275 [Morganella morganii subsp. morganii]|nr:hypothetical protein [Morganella morganii subsp. morganii]